MLVIDPGSLNIKSLAPPTREIMKERLQDHLYDRFSITLNDSHITLFQNDSYNIPYQPNLSLKSGYSILDPFEIQLLVGNLFCPPSESLPKTRLSVYSQGANININANSINLLIDLSSTYQSIISSNKIEEETIYIVPDSDNGDGFAVLAEKEEQDKEETISSSLNLRKIDVHVSISECTINLTKDSINDRMIFFTLNSFTLQLMMRSKDILMLATLQDIYLYDLLQSNGPLYKYLIASRDIGDLQNDEFDSTNQPPFLMIELTSFKDTRLNNYKNIDNQIGITCNGIYCMFNPDSLTLIIEEMINKIKLSNENNDIEEEDDEFVDVEDNDEEYLTLRRSQSLTIHKNQPYTPKRSKKVQKKKRKEIKLSEKERNRIKLQLIFKLKEALIRLNDKGDILSTLHLKDFGLQFNQLKPKIEVITQLHYLSLENMNVKFLYPLNVDSSLFTLTYTKYKFGFVDTPLVKQELSLLLNPICFIISPRILFDIIMYFDSIISSLKIIKTEQMNNSDSSNTIPKDKSSKSKGIPILFNICIRQPHIIIPKNSLSPDMLHICFGEIGLQNQPIEENNCLIEMIHVSMNDAFINIGILPMNEESQIVSISFDSSLELIHIDNSNSLPKLKISGNLYPIHIDIIEDDLIKLVSILSQFSQEVKLRLEYRSAKTVVTHTKPKKESTIVSKVEDDNSLNTVESSESKTKMLVDFIIQDISIKLTNNEKSKYIVGVLQNISLSVLKNSNSTKLGLSFGNIKIDNYIDNFTKSILSFKEDKKICLYLEQSKSEISISSVINKPKIFILPGLLKLLKDIGSLPYELSVPSNIATSIPTIPTQASLEDKNEITGLPVEEKKSNEKSIQISIDLVELQVICAADENSSSFGIVLKNSMAAKIKKTSDSLNILSYIEDLEMYSCQLDDKEGKSSIIKPSSLLFEMKTSTNSLDLVLTIEPVFICISYKDIKFCTNMVKLLLPESTPKNQKSEKTMSSTIIKASKPKPVKPVAQSLNIAIGGVCFTLVDDISGSNIPLINFKVLSISSKIKDWSTAFSSEIQLSLQAYYFNRFKSCWEPLIEPWSQKLQYCKAPIDKDTSPSRFRRIIGVSSKEILNINISKTFIDTMKSTTTAWANNINAPEDYHRQPETVVIKNETGCKLKIILKGQGELTTLLLDESDTKELMTNELHKSGNIINDAAEMLEYTASVQLAPGEYTYKPVQYLPIHRTGSWSVSLESYSSEEKDYSLQWNVELKKTKRIVTIRSCTVVYNNCSTPIELQINESNEIFEILPNEYFSMPIALSWTANIQIRKQNGTWSDTIFCGESYSAQFEISSAQVDGTLVYFQVSYSRKSKSLRITISPPIQIEYLLPVKANINLIPIPIKVAAFSRKSHSERKPQEPKQLQMNQGDITEYYECHSFVALKLSIEIQGFLCSPITLIELEDHQPIRIHDTKDRPLLLYLCNELTPNGNCRIIIFAKYWLVNKTGIPALFKSKNSKYIAAGQEKEEEYHNSHTKALSYKRIITPEHNEEFKPILYSYPDESYLFKSKTCMKLIDSEWSEGIPIESVGTKGGIEMKQTKGKIQYNIGVSIELLTGRYFRTKLISFIPTFVLINQLNTDLYFRQSETETGYLLKSSKEMPFHWMDITKPNEICISPDKNHYWSPTFKISRFIEFAMNIKGKGNTKDYPVLVNIQSYDASYLVIFREYKSKYPPFRIENCTGCKIRYNQKYLDDNPIEIDPYSQMGYFFDIPDVKEHVIVLSIPKYNFTKEYSVNRIKKYKPITITNEGESLTITIEVLIDKVTRVIQIIDNDTHPIQKLDSDKETDLLRLSLHLYGIGISIIDERPQEMLYISLHQFILGLEQTAKELSLNVYLNDIQIDNQLADAVHPILLSTRYGLYPNEDSNVFEMVIVKSNRYKSITFFENVSILIRELELRLDDGIINKLVEFANMKISTSNDPNFDKMTHYYDVKPKKSSAKWYFSLLHIHPLDINLTFSLINYPTKNDVPKSNRTNFVITISSAIGLSIANMENAPIQLSRLYIESVSQSQMLNRIGKHYKQQALWVIYALLGSFDILGNPMTLINSLQTGVSDFIKEPKKGIENNSPVGFLTGIQKGTASLFKNSVIGFVGTAANISKTLGKGTTRLASDQKFIESRITRSRDMPDGFLQGLWWGTKEFSGSVQSGAKGLIRLPVRYGKENGVPGIIQGTTNGLLDLVVLPSVGVFDFSTRATQGIKNMVIKDIQHCRVRPARGFGPGKILLEYNIEKATGHTIMMSFFTSPNHEEFHLFHCLVKDRKQLVLVSNKNFFLIEISSQSIDTKISLPRMYFYNNYFFKLFYLILFIFI